MKPVYHALLRFSLAMLLLAAGAEIANAQQIGCRSEPTEIPWRVPPAIAAVNGDMVAGTPGTVYISQRTDASGRGGPLEVWKLSLGTLEQETTLTPGVELPAGILGIWDIQALGDGSIIALISYAEGGNEWYGFLKGGVEQEWTLIKPAALQTPHFEVVEGMTQGSSVFTGNYWRVPLYEMEWLEDGLHGWAWGRKGIVRTTDGGNTWSVAYEAPVTNTQSIGSYQPIWGVAFKDADSGSAVMGTPVGSSFRQTTDGGETWTVGLNLAVNRLADLQYVHDEYRAIAFNRTIRASNTFLFVSQDGRNYSTRGNINSRVLTESVYATEVVWPTAETGFFIQREGETWRTDDNGATWTQIQEEDDQYDTVLFGDGTSIAGTGTPPFFPYAGYAQRTVAVSDDFGDTYLVNVLTDTCIGTMRNYVAVWPVDPPASVSDKGTSVASLSVAPNPARDRCEVRFTLTIGSPVSALLVDTRGAVLKRIDYGRLSAGSYDKVMNLEGVPSGTYRLVVRTEEGERTEAVVVQR